MKLFFRTPDFHEVLDIAFSSLTINGSYPFIIRALTKNVNSNFKFVRYFLVFISSIFQPIQCYLALGNNKTIIVREFWNFTLLALSPVFFPIRKKIVFNINHNLSGFEDSYPRSLVLLARFGFRFLLMDGKTSILNMPHENGGGIYHCLFPIHHPAVSKGINRRPIVGRSINVALIGDMRREKMGSINLEDIACNILENENFNILIGTRRQTNNLNINSDRIEIYDTSEKKDYIELLEKSDFVVIMATRSAYFYRHSGTIMDTIKAGAIPVVPNYPVFNSQICEPCLVGIYYNSVFEISEKINKSLEFYQFYNSKRKQYLNYRSTINLEIS